MESVWYYVVNGAQTGPITLAELKRAVTDRKLTPLDLVWKDGMADWVAASTVPELFAVTPPHTVQSSPSGVYPLSPPPAQLQNRVSAILPGTASSPEPLSLDEEGESAREPRKKAKARRDYDAGDSLPPTPVPEWVKLIGVFLRRVFNPNPSQVVPLADEESTLTRAGVMDATVRKFAVWRRSVLFVAAVPCVFASLFGLINVINLDKDEKELFNLLGMFLLYIQAFALFALPVAAVLGALTYDRLAISTKLVFLGGVISFAVPLAIAFVPSDWLIDLKTSSTTTVGEVEVMKRTWGVALGIQFYLLLLPLVLSLLPAVARACVRMKLFLPESLVPGWGLVTSAPLCVLLTLATFVLLYHIAGNALLIIGLMLWIGAPLLYLTKFNLLTRPVTSPADQMAIVRTSFIVFSLMVVGVLLFVIYLFTTTLVGKTLVGFDESSSFIRPWSLQIHKKWIEYVGRSLFLSVFFGDLILRMAISVWREERAFVGSESAANFDRTMTGLDSAILPRG